MKMTCSCTEEVHIYNMRKCDSLEIMFTLQKKGRSKKLGIIIRNGIKAFNLTDKILWFKSTTNIGSI